MKLNKQEREDGISKIIKAHFKDQDTTNCEISLMVFMEAFISDLLVQQRREVGEMMREIIIGCSPVSELINWDNGSDFPKGHDSCRKSIKELYQVRKEIIKIFNKWKGQDEQ